MNAQIARETAYEIAIKPDVKDMMTAIEAAVLQGKFFTWYYKDINEHQRNFLKKEGYKVDNMSDQRDGILFKISW